MPLGEYMSGTEVCDFLRIDRLTLRRMIRAKKLKPVRFTMRNFFLISDIKKYLSSLPVDKEF